MQIASPSLSAAAAPLLIVILVGVPGSGKSTFSRALMAGSPQPPLGRSWRRVSQHLLGSCKKCIADAAQPPSLHANRVTITVSCCRATTDCHFRGHAGLWQVHLQPRPDGCTQHAGARHGTHHRAQTRPLPSRQRAESSSRVAAVRARRGATARPRPRRSSRWPREGAAPNSVAKPTDCVTDCESDVPPAFGVRCRDDAGREAGVIGLPITTGQSDASSAPTPPLWPPRRPPCILCALKRDDPPHLRTWPHGSRSRLPCPLGGRIRAKTCDWEGNLTSERARENCELTRKPKLRGYQKLCNFLL